MISTKNTTVENNDEDDDVQSQEKCPQSFPATQFASGGSLSSLLSHPQTYHVFRSLQRGSSPPAAAVQTPHHEKRSVYQ